MPCPSVPPRARALVLPAVLALALALSTAGALAWAQQATGGAAASPRRAATQPAATRTGSAARKQPTPAKKAPATGAAAGADPAVAARAARAARDSARWPVKTPPPLPGSILPARRIVAYYGNPLSKRMGALGEYPVDEMLARLDREVARWNAADPGTPVQPALHLIATVAQGSAGKDGMYRYRAHPELIEKVHGWAKRKNAILFLDVQIGKSTLEAEVQHLLPYLQRPDVHLGLDPEFAMTKGGLPGKKVGTYDARHINYAIGVLADLVTRHKLPPKVLVVHRFTRPMLTNTDDIKLDPRVQVVIHMDGWGAPHLKRATYRQYIVPHPVQFTGFKLFYHNDTKKGDPLMQPKDVLALFPKPLYIQYQ
jgi:hypothetical protein